MIAGYYRAYETDSDSYVFIHRDYNGDIHEGKWEGYVHHIVPKNKDKPFDVFWPTSLVERY